MADDGPPISENRSVLKDFIASVATMSGDLSNITAPPSVLATKSVIEIPAFWAENPTIFVSPARSDDPVQRALLVLRAFLAGCRSQCYMGHNIDAGVKKPLNAFLGELFLGRWEDENGTTQIVSEQVSHHPPISACRVWNDKYGVVSEGYNRQSITFNGSVNVQCTGHILRSLTKYDEHYLMPIPDFKIRGVLGTPYPELSDTYYIPSSSGYTSVIHFSGSSMFSSAQKNKFKAHLYRAQEGESKPLYTIEGHWDTEFTITDNKAGKDVEVFNIEANALRDLPDLIIDPVDQQDPWESRNAWQDTVTAIRNNNMQGVSDSKGRIEQGQRDMRDDEKQRGQTWIPLFFRSTQNDKLIRRLNEQIPDEDYRKSKEATSGVWEFSMEAWKNAKKPYHGSLRPDNTTVGGAQTSKSKSEEQQQPSKSQQPQQSQGPQSSMTDSAGAAIQQRLPAKVNRSSADVSRQHEARNFTINTSDPPALQVAHTEGKDRHGSGVPGMGVDEKTQIENMLREQSSTASQTRRASHAKRKSLGT